jgi:uncharacterized protein (UPF0332 family)
MTEIDSFLARAKKYLASAELLRNVEDYESSVSRTYYAMLYATQALLLTKNLSFSSHQKVISLFGEQFIKTGIFPGKWVEKSTGLFKNDSLENMATPLALPKMRLTRY